MKQDYILKKHVRAETATEALMMDATTQVHEVFLASDKPEKGTTRAIGFQTVGEKSDEGVGDTPNSGVA